MNVDMLLGSNGSRVPLRSNAKYPNAAPDSRAETWRRVDVCSGRRVAQHVVDELTFCVTLSLIFEPPPTPIRRPNPCNLT